MSNLKTTRVDLSIDGYVAEICLVPPEGKPPTLDQTVLSELEEKVATLEQSQVRLVYLKSASERFFCVGANIAVLKETNAQTIGPWVKNGHRILNRLEDLPCPVVALVSGYVMGGGLELAMACDLIFSDDSAKFAQSEASLGFIPGWGGSRRLVDRIGVAKAKYYFFTGEMLDSQTALSCGLVDFAGTSEDRGEFMDSFTQRVLDNNYNAISTFKKIVNREMLDARVRNAELEAVNSVSCLEDKDTLNRLNAFLIKKG
ncbi:MAG: enoyl-CoA hydratase/isomerase family protein [Puniceicoccaceae bacterium]